MGKGCLLSSLLLVQLLLLVKSGMTRTTREFSRDDFPLSPDFVFGAGTSAFQVEGAAAEDGRTPSIWDTFTHAVGMPDGSTADVAADMYHKYEEDVRLMADTGLEAYRFSISWSRLLPNGSGAVNPKGLEFYNNLINELVKHGIEPHATLFQLDLPQVLEDEYGGWLSPNIVDDFTAYADVCFREFGDRVAHWTTIDEPNVLAMAAYDAGTFPPNRCSYPFGTLCTAGNSSVEPYIALHNMLLAHASIAKLYRRKYQAMQKGWIGINVYGFWCYPLRNTSADTEAAKRALAFFIGWILNPVVFGDYPEVMKKNAGSRLPSFTKRQSEEVKGSIDFIGLNYYLSAYVVDSSRSPNSGLRDFSADIFAKFTVLKNETPTAQFKPPTRIPYNPSGLHAMLEYLKEAYGNLPVYIQENGYGLGVKDDTDRIHFLSGYIGSTLDAMRGGANVRGYFMWSFIDGFEFLAGYTARFGLFHVDFDEKERKREPRLSAFWYSNLLKKGEEKKDMNIRRTSLYATS